MNTAADTAESKALPQGQVSPFVAAARPSKNTSEDPDAMASGQLVESVMRAAGLAMYDFLSTIFQDRLYQSCVEHWFKAQIANQLIV